MLLFRAIFCLAGVMVACAETHADSTESPEAEPTADVSSDQDQEVISLSALEVAIQGDNTVRDLLNDLCEQFSKKLDDDEREGTQLVPSRRKRSGYGYGGYGGRYGGYDRDYVDYGSSYGDHYGGGYDGGYGGYSGYGNRYGSGYGGYNHGYGNKGYLSYDKSHTSSPILTFVKGFKPGKSYVEKGKVVRNYYRHGTYEVALQHYKFIPVIKVVPYTTYDTVGYTGHIQAHNDYTAVICKDCYHGYPKIDVVANVSPYSSMTRRFVYLPENYRIDSYEG